MLTKKDQLRKNAPLKTKPLKDAKYLSWFHNQGFGCFVCGNTSIEAHHVLSGNRGRPDDSVVPLCNLHHTGSKFSAHGADAKQFYEEYTKEMLLKMANILYQTYKEASDFQ